MAADNRTASVRRCNLAIAAVFVAAISLPAAANLAGMDGADAAAENRELADWPRLGSAPSAAAYATAFGRWFEDHFGFRATLVRWYGETRLFWLGVSPSPAVIKGRDGWLFYADDGGIEDCTNETALSAAELEDWRDALVATRDWLRARGMAYVFTIAPDKHAIYSEELPPGLRRVHAESRADQVHAMLAHGTDIAYVDVRPALFEAKRRERIYFQTYTHWNERGVLVAYQQLVDAVRRQTPAVPPPWTREDFQPAERTVQGMDLARMIGLMRVLHEVDLTLIPKRLRRARVVEPAGAEPSAEEGRLATEIAGSPLPRAVVFRDSFGSRLAPFLSEHFSRAVYLWQNDFDPEIVLRERPDVVIQEIAGRHLYVYTPSPELVPR